MKLHNRASYLRAAPEEQPPQRTLPKVTQWLYFLFLIFIACYVVYFFIHRSLTLTTQGVVTTDTVPVKARYDGIVASLSMTQDATLSRGTVLGMIEPKSPCEQKDNQHALTEMTYDIEDEKIALSLMQKELLIAQNEFDQLLSDQRQLRRALELTAPVTEETVKMKADLARQKARIQAKKEAISHLTQRRALLADKPLPPLPPSCQPQLVTSPTSGRVLALNVSVGDAVKAGDTLALIVPLASDAVVEVHLPPEEASDIEPGDTFSGKVKNTSIKLKVVGIHTAASSTLKQDKNSYQPVMPGVQLTLAPASPEDAAMLLKFNRYTVTIEGRK